VNGGKTVTVEGQPWTFPSETQCFECHTVAAGRSLGPETAQLNKAITYPSTSRLSNQLATLEHIGMFTNPLPNTPALLPALEDPYNSNQPLDGRARAWLHSNCANCHRPSGPTNVDMDLRYDTPFSAMSICNIDGQNGDWGLTNPKRLLPGDANRSLIVERAARRGPGQMPPLASHITDDAGITLLTDWINGMTGCN
ncbi:MAG: hypothetical protein MI754_04190, partial [Chromatiales bacterium]|nr:hypothetical protein [Chromatiales bacterium]